MGFIWHVHEIWFLAIPVFSQGKRLEQWKQPQSWSSVSFPDWQRQSHEISGVSHPVSSNTTLTGKDSHAQRRFLAAEILQTKGEPLQQTTFDYGRVNGILNSKTTHFLFFHVSIINWKSPNLGFLQLSLQKEKKQNGTILKWWQHQPFLSLFGVTISHL